MVKPKVISTFAGGGGSSLGYHWAGYEEILAIDFDKNACDTLKANFPELTVWQRDITTVQIEEILQQCKIKVRELDLLDGSPPCQGFSTAGKRNLNDSRNDLFKEFVRLIEGLQPKVFVMENVSGMIKGGYKGKFNEILQILKNTGYNVKCKLMNAMWYEVPQSRERVIFIGVRNDLNIEPSYPNPINKTITVKEAIKGVQNKTYTKNIKGYFQEKIYSKIKQGQNGLNGKYFNTRRLHPDKVCPTLCKSTSWAGFAQTIHPFEDRDITIEEAKRFCSFPDKYILLGTYSEQWNRLGNAVMPKMMYYIAKHIKDNVLNGCKK